MLAHNNSSALGALRAAEWTDRSQIPALWLPAIGHRHTHAIRLMDVGGRDVTLLRSRAPIPVQIFAPT
jgi:hypothetical protein